MAVAAGISALSSPFPYIFEAELERFGVGKTRKVWYNVLMLPDALKAELPFTEYPRLRVEGEIADVPIANAFIPTGDGRYYVIVGPDVIKAADLTLGDYVDMRFAIADQDAVDIPDLLEQALETDSQARSVWAELTPGKQRALAQHVKSAKTDPTRRRRTDEALDVIVNYKADFRAWRDARRAEKS